MATDEEEKISLPAKHQELMDQEPNDPLTIINKLLSTEEHRKIKNRLIEDFKYDNEGSNGLFEAQPRVVKIAGFEINKKVSVKVSLVNKSKFSERVIILPPTTPYFTIKYSKRGQIPPGLSETIHITFSPQSYQLYSDAIRINCPGDKIIIPINAYPRMNIFVKDYIPRMVDLGNVTIDTTTQKEIKLKNVIDIPFNYSITPIRPIEEVEVSPLENEIKPFSSRALLIQFAPKKYGFFRGEYEFRINEYDFLPFVFSIVGTCNTFGIRYANRTEDDFIESSDSLLKQRSKNINPKPLALPEEEKSASDISSGLPLQPPIKDAPQKSPAKQPEVEEESKPTLARPESKTLQKFKDFPSNIEREYLNFYNSAEGVIQAKEFKYIPFIGKELLTPEETSQLLTEKLNDKNAKINAQCQIDKDRHQIEYDREKCEVDKNIKYYLKPNFNSNQNDNFFKTRHYFKLFLKGMTKVIIRKRAEKNISQLKAMIDKNSIKSREDFKKYVEQDWIDYFSKDQRGADDDTSFNFLKMKFIQPSFLFREQVYLTNEYSIDSLKQQISHDNNINLDEYTEYEPLERNDLEVIGYVPFVPPGLTQFDVNLGEKPLRPGCEAENLIRDERGDTELAFEKTSALYEIPEECLKHIDCQPEDLIFNNPSLKRYVPLNAYTENSIDYNLQPRKVKFKEELTSNYINDLYMRTNLSYCDNGLINMKQIDTDYLLCDTSLNFMPKRLKAADQKDLNIKRGEKVDEDNYLYELIKEDEAQLIDLIEKDDENIQKERQLNKNEVFDARKQGRIALENTLQMQKRKWMATVPTLLEYFNSGIVNPNNKFLL